MIATEHNSEKFIAKDTEIDTLPSVTVAIPVLNEEKHIRRVVEGFLNNSYENLIEILVADGGSTDKTREIVKELSQDDPRVKLIENPEKFQSFGLNRMIEVAQGEVFLRADGHCHYKRNYIEKCVETMRATGARNVGGAQRYMAKNKVQAGIALAVKSILGNGGAKYMNEEYLGFADTVFLGCFRTNDLRDIGGFNTENVTNQDSELNLRLIEQFGETVYVSPEIQSWYYPRNTFWRLFKQYFRYGRGRHLTRVLHPQTSPIRGMIPFMFLFALTAFMITDLFLKANLYSLEFLAGLGVIVLLEAARVTSVKKEVFDKEIWVEQKKKPGFITKWIFTAFSLMIMQFGHFFGYLFQLLKRIFTGKKGW